MQTVGLFFLVLFVFMSIGVPIAVVLMLCGMAMMASLGYFEPTTLSMNVMQGINSFPLMAIPFFVLSGELMSKGGLSRRIVNFAKLAVGRIRGGLGYTAIFASMLFAGLSGSGVADAAAIGGMLIPLMVYNKYNKERATALVSSGGILAPLIPPSTPFILLGTVCNLSITKLFMGGLVPGIMIGFGLMFVWFFIVRKDNYNDTVKYSWKEVLPILKDSVPALMLIVIIVGGIRFGLFTPTEAGSCAVLYALAVCKFFYRELTLKKLYEALRDTVSTTAAVVVIVGAATMAGYYLTLARVPVNLTRLLMQVSDRPIVLMLMLNAFLLLMGMLMDIAPNILIFAPILLPVGISAGFDSYYFAFIIGLNLIIGAITPPVGTVMFVSAKVGGVKVAKLVSKQWPFLCVYIFFLILFIIFPELYLIPMRWLTT
jgi:tripartite ATP-independent transporter DctM subunit